MINFARTIFATLFAAIIMVIAAYGYIQNYATTEGELQESTTIIIDRGTSFTEIVNLLYDANVIDNKLIFRAYVIIEDKQSQFKAGEYRFDAGITPQEIVNILVEGESITHAITIAEGLIVEDIVGIINAESKLSGSLIDPSTVEEGSLLPETYHFLRGDSRENIIARMQKAMKETVESLWENRQENLPLKNPKEAIILASIVEKETGIDAERRRVAAVFINRLRIGMKLQSDPTTIYGIYKETGKRVKRLRTKDLRSENPYNTYYIEGLPPSPIANPGRASIEAVLNPLDTDEYYFVATGEGGHNFSKTLKEHNRNVKKYLQQLKKIQKQ